MNRHALSVAAALVALLCSAGPARAFPTESLRSSGPSANRLDLVILGDGYRAEDQAQLTTDASAVLAALFAEDVWQRYRDFVNVTLVHVESVDNGADNGSLGPNRNTALGAYFDCNGIDRLLCVDSTAVLDVAMADAPQFDQIIVVVNDSKYGGAGGQFSTTSIAPAAVDIAVHELGHSLFDLADEYATPYPGYPSCDVQADCPEPNASLFATQDANKWSQWIEDGTPLPTPDEDSSEGLVGAVEGARYQDVGVYRPTRDCLMRTLGRHLCPVCTEAGVLAHYSYTQPVDSLSPAGPVSISTAQSQQFRVDGPRPSPNTLRFAWSVDGVLRASNDTGRFELVGSTLSVGVHTVTVDIRDDTTLVREDPSALLIETRSWSVSVTPAQVADWRSFESTSRPWTTSFPFAVQSVSDASQGARSLEVHGCIAVPITSPAFRLGELGRVGGRLALDVKLPALQAIPFWSGNLQVALTAPGALLFNTNLGSAVLLATPLDRWTTVNIDLPWWLGGLVSGSNSNASLTITLQNASCLQPIRIDNLRFLP